jgi:O-antigen ligase
MILLQALLGLLAPVGAFAPKGLSVLLPLLAVAAWFQARPALPQVAWRLAPMAPLVLVGLASALWSITPSASFARGVTLVGEALCVAVLATALPRLPVTRVLAPVAAGLALAMAATVIELRLGGPATQYFRGMSAWAVPAALSNGLTVAVLLLPPCLAFLWGWRRAAALALLLLVAAAALLGGQLAARIGLVAGLGAGALALLVPWAGRAVALGFAALVVALPLLLPLPENIACSTLLTKPSISHRVHIWNFAEAKRAERPWLGWGLETARAIPGGRDMADIFTPCGIDVMANFPSTEKLPLHTHNAGLQWWVELGPLGVASALFLVLVLGFRARSAAAVGSLGAGLAILLLSYGAWQGWWLATLGMVAAIALTCPSITGPASGRHPPRSSGP